MNPWVCANEGSFELRAVKLVCIYEPMYVHTYLHHRNVHPMYVISARFRGRVAHLSFMHAACMQHGPWDGSWIMDFVRVVGVIDWRGRGLAVAAGRLRAGLKVVEEKLIRASRGVE